jgi:hypothetical protein
VVTYSSSSAVSLVIEIALLSAMSTHLLVLLGGDRGVKTVINGVSRTNGNNLPNILFK